MFSGFVSTLRQFVVKTPQIQPVRYRYFTEKRKYIKRYGYEDTLARGGLLPHYGDKRITPFPEYKYTFIYKASNPFIKILVNLTHFSLIYQAKKCVE